MVVWRCLFNIAIRFWVRAIAAAKGLSGKVGVCIFVLFSVCFALGGSLCWGLAGVGFRGATPSTIISTLVRKASYAWVSRSRSSFVLVGKALVSLIWG